METKTLTDDPLDQAIAALQEAMSHDQADIAELDALLEQKKLSLQTLSVEIRALKRAAALRPSTAAMASTPAAASGPTLVADPAPVSDPVPVSEQARAPEPQPSRIRNVFGQIRTSDPRLAVLSGG